MRLQQSEFNKSSELLALKNQMETIGSFVLRQTVNTSFGLHNN